MKDFLVAPYTFSPAGAGLGTIQLSIDNFSINRLVALINATRGVVLYASGDSTRLLSSVNGNVLTLAVDTTGHNANDVIQIIYNTPNPLDVALSSLEVFFKSVLSAIQYPNYLDRTLNAIRVAVINTIGTITTVTGVGTVSTVSAVNTTGTLTNQTNIGSYTADIQNYAGLRSAWGLTVRNRIS